MEWKKISIPVDVLTVLDEARGDKARHEIITHGLNVRNNKNEMIKLLDYLTENTMCRRGDENRIKKAMMKLYDLISEI